MDASRDDLQLLRPMEVARLLGVSRAAVYRLIQTGAVPSVRLGDRIVRVPRRALEERLAELLRGGAR